MAEGVLLLLVGDENKKRKEYEKLSKEYESGIVLGITTDSFDALGIINDVKPDNYPLKRNFKLSKKFYRKTKTTLSAILFKNRKREISFGGRGKISFRKLKYQKNKSKFIR